MNLRKGHFKDRFNPLRLLTLAIALNIALLPILGSLVWNMYSILQETTGRTMKLQRLAGAITNLNETLTMASRLYAITGNEKWRDKYRNIEPKLDDSLLEVAMLAREDYEKNYASQAKMAYTRLIELENLAFALGRAGRLEEAYDILSGPNYYSQKSLYSRAIDQLSRAIELRVTAKTKRFHSSLKFAAILGALSVILLIVSWLGVITLVRRRLIMRQLAEQALSDEKERLQVTLNSITEGVITTDINGKISSMNPVAEKLTGWSADRGVGLPLEEVFRVINGEEMSASETLVYKVLKKLSVFSKSSGSQLISKDNTLRSVSQTAAPILDSKGGAVGVVLVFKDISEELRLRDEALKADKLESLGRLAGGIAHDFNNFLTSIMGNISLLERGFQLHTPNKRLAEEAIRACGLARGLTAQLLTFSKGWTPMRKKADLKTSLCGWVDFALRGAKVSRKFHCDSNLHITEIDEGQINQVISNLVINACQAMPEGGRVSVRAENRHISSEEAVNLIAGDYVCIKVRDEGIGISPESLKRIFDPYFTNKPFGNGLGLATSYAVVKAHGGQIQVDSTPGKGSVFQVYLPAIPGEGPIDAPESPVIYDLQARILFMDDDELIREVVHEALIALGHTVDLASSGEEAVQKFQEQARRGAVFDAVIMDLTIKGGMGGQEAITRMRAIDPSIRAIVSSGYSNDPVMGDYKNYGFNHALAKPFTVEELARAITRVLKN